MPEMPEPEKSSSETGDMPAPTVWPPPPTNSPPLPAGKIPPVFLPLHRIGRTLVILLGMYTGLAVLGVAGALVAMPATTRQSVVGIVASVQALLLLGTGICFLIWTYRLNKNLRAFGVSGLRTGPAWAVAYFFIPILSIYRPYQVFREIWQASAPTPEVRTENTWLTTKTPAILGFWWMSFLLMNVMDALSSESSGATDIDAADNAVGFISALLALQVVRIFTARQENTAHSLF